MVGTAPNEAATLVASPRPPPFSLLAPAYFKKYGLDADKGKDVLSRIAWKNHRNGAKNPRRSSRRKSQSTQSKTRPKLPIRSDHGLLGRIGGSAAAIVVRAEDAHKYRKDPIYIKALSFIAGPGEGPMSQEYDFTTFPEVVASAKDAYAQAESKTRAKRSAWRRCTMLHPDRVGVVRRYRLQPARTAWRDVMEGFFELEGKLPVNPDGGLKSFGHPIGASGLRMMYEMWLQLRGEAGPRQIDNPRLGLTHNLGAPRPLRQLRIGGRETMANLH